jgi:hypothetical protein
MRGAHKMTPKANTNPSAPKRMPDIFVEANSACARSSDSIASAATAASGRRMWLMKKAAPKGGLSEFATTGGASARV